MLSYVKRRLAATPYDEFRVDGVDADAAKKPLPVSMDEASMEYRLYWLDETGRIAGARSFSARDDLMALHEAEGACEKNAIEVWQGTRLVARVKLGNGELGPSDRMSL